MEPINSTGIVTTLATFTGMLGLRCVMHLAGKRLWSPLAVRVEPLLTNECNSRAAAYGESRSRRVGRRSGGTCRDDWHRACGWEDKKQVS
eukprot:2969289-Pleurochrysis_carterae.AAC.3